MADYHSKDEVTLTSVVHYEQLKSDEPVPPYVSSVELASSTPHPRDHVIWSLFNSMFLNFCCLGFLALVFSFKARDRKILRDLDGAGHYASTAKVLNIISTTLGLIATIALIAYMIIIRFGGVG